jgi:hypothetical protein
MYLRTLKALQDLQKGRPEQAGQPTALPESGSPPTGDKRKPSRNSQPLMPSIGSVPSFTRAPAGRPQTQRSAPAEHAPPRHD